MVHKNVTKFFSRLSALSMSSSPDSIASVALYMTFQARHASDLISSWKARVGALSLSEVAMTDFRVVNAFVTAASNEDFHKNSPELRAALLDEICAPLICKVLQGTTTGNPNSTTANKSAFGEEIKAGIDMWADDWASADVKGRCSRALLDSKEATAGDDKEEDEGDKDDDEGDKGEDEDKNEADVPPRPPSNKNEDEDENEDEASYTLRPPPSFLPPQLQSGSAGSDLSSQFAALDAKEMTRAVLHDGVLRLRRTLKEDGASQDDWLKKVRACGRWSDFFVDDAVPPLS